MVLNQKFLSKIFSEEGLSNKAKLNAIAAVVDYTARLAVGFVINPLLVTGLGDFAYGTWQVLGRLIGYISPASGRPSQALKWTIANQQGSVDYQEKRRLVGSAVTVWLIFVPILAVLGGILVYFVPLWLDTPAEFFSTVRLATALLVVNLIMISLADLPRSVLVGENLEYKRMGLSAGLVIVGGGLTALALYSSSGLVGVAAATLSTTLLTGLLFFRIMRSHVPWFGISRPSSQMVRQFTRLSGWFLLWNLVMQVMRGSDVVVLGAIDSVEQVTVYTLSKYVPETIISIVAMIVFGITPGLGAIIGTGNHRKAIAVRSEITIYTWLLAVTAGVAVLLWNESFLQLWVGTGYYVGAFASLMIVIMMLQFVLIRNDASIIDLTLKLRHKVMLGLISAGVAAALAAFFVGPLETGIAGLCFGIIVGRSILSVAYPWLIGRRFGFPIFAQAKSSIRPALVTIFLFGFSLGVSSKLAANNWFSLVISGLLTASAALIIAFVAGLTRGQQSLIFNRTRALVSSRL